MAIEHIVIVLLVMVILFLLAVLILGKDKSTSEPEPPVEESILEAAPFLTKEEDLSEADYEPQANEPEPTESAAIEIPESDAEWFARYLERHGPVVDQPTAAEPSDTLGDEDIDIPDWLRAAMLNDSEAPPTTTATHPTLRKIQIPDDHIKEFLSSLLNGEPLPTVIDLLANVEAAQIAVESWQQTLENLEAQKIKLESIMSIVTLQTTRDEIQREIEATEEEINQTRAGLQLEKDAEIEWKKRLSLVEASEALLHQKSEGES